jgi:hypothetical protein
MLLRSLIIVLISVGVVHAECYTRSSTVTSQTNQIERITDLEQTVMPNKCRVTFRALINGNWYTAEGEATGSLSSQDVCATALSQGRIRILEKVSDTNLSSSQELICTDQEMPQLKPTVKVGDLVRESEVKVHPSYPYPFPYRGGQCRWFTESIPQSGKVDVHQGIICKAGEKVWRVVDKW